MFRLNIKIAAAFLPLALSAIVSPAHAQTIANAGFETPNVAPGTFSSNPTGASWTFSGNAGISSNGGTFNYTTGNPNAPEGTQVAYLQIMGNISQSITGFQSGVSYVLTFAAAQRAASNSIGYNNQQNFNVLLDNTIIGAFQPTTTTYINLSAQFITTQGTHTLTFVGLDTVGGDQTALIDNVRLTSVPEPGSFALLATSALTGAGFLMRRRKRARIAV